MNSIMPTLSSFISQDVFDQSLVEDIAWSLIHFLWEGFVLAAAFHLATTLCRNARVRYAAGFATLIAMAAAPVITFFIIHGGDPAGVPVPGLLNMHADAVAATSAGVTVPSSLPWLEWLVMAYAAGVLLLSIRLAGGWYMADLLRTRGVQPLPAALQDRFRRLARQARISRPVRFLQSAMVNAPAVVGWLRPVVLIPMSAITGLTAPQLEAVIMHELAHIRRLDAFANLAQMIVETVLFYHPAVWWVSRRIRAERENCCDDSAVALTGNAVDYARALTVLAAWRAAPAPALGATGGVLTQRIARLLGLSVKPDTFSPLALALIGAVCLAGGVVAYGPDVAAGTNTAVVSGDVSPVVVAAADAPAPLVPPPAVGAAPVPPAPPALPALPAPLIDTPIIDQPIIDRPIIDRDAIDRQVRESIRDQQQRIADLQRELAREDADRREEQNDRAAEQAERTRETAARTAERAMEQQQANVGRAAATAARAAEREAARQARAYDHGHNDDAHTHDGAPVDPTYLKDMDAAGLHGLSADLAIALKSEGITPDYVRGILATGVHASAQQLLAFRSEGVDAAYVQGLAATGLNLPASQIIALRSQGVTADFARNVHAAWPEATLRDISDMRALGVDPAAMAEYKRLGLSGLSVHEVISYQAVGVTPEYTRSLRAAGVDLASLPPSQLAAFKATGVTPELIKALRSMGIKDLTTHDYITAQVRGLTPDFLAAVRNHNFTNLSFRQLMAFKDANVF